MLTLDSYLMGRRELFPDEWTFERELNAQDLILRVNNLFQAIPMLVTEVTSGWRPIAVNIRSGGVKRSLHLIAKAVDLEDGEGLVKSAIVQRPELLLDFGLWMEHPVSTPGWIHLDTGMRDNRIRRIFMP